MPSDNYTCRKVQIDNKKMEAIEFSNLYTRAVKDFFSNCLNKESISLHTIQYITVCFTEKGFELRLETIEYTFSQEFDATGKEIIPLSLSLSPYTGKQHNKKIELKTEH